MIFHAPNASTTTATPIIPVRKTGVDLKKVWPVFSEKTLKSPVQWFAGRFQLLDYFRNKILGRLDVELFYIQLGPIHITFSLPSEA
jgi:hypothetical protein